MDLTSLSTPERPNTIRECSVNDRSGEHAFVGLIPREFVFLAESHRAQLASFIGQERLADAGAIAGRNADARP